MNRLQSTFAALAGAILVGTGSSQNPDPAARARELAGAGDLAAAATEFGRLARANPYDGDLWGNWGYCLHGLGRFAEALPCYLEAVRLGRAPAANLYNAACALARLGRKDEALARLAESLSHRFARQDTLATDADLDSLRGEPRFAELTGIVTGLRTPLAHDRVEGWRWDLEFFLRRMQQMHWNLYGCVSAQRLRDEVDRLATDVASLDDDQVRVRLRRVVALVGDGHTSSRLFAEDATTRRRLRLEMFAFREGLYVTAAEPEHADLVGTRVEKVGPMTAAAALAATRPYVPADNEMGHLDNGPAMLTVPAVLHEIGAAPDTSGVTLTVRSQRGETRQVQLAPVSVPIDAAAAAELPALVSPWAKNELRPAYLRHSDRNLAIDELPEHGLLYFWFGGVENDRDETVAAFTERLVARIETAHATRLVVDMRSNGGGNTGLVAPLVTAIAACKAINRPGHLFVVIGRGTFSAAQNVVNMLDALTDAIFVGEPTGSRPRFVGESTWFVLPHSNTRVYCSSRYWQFLDSTDDRCWVPPSIVAEPNAEDYFAGRDPAMTAILAAISR